MKALSLLVIPLFLSACQGAPKFPTDKLWEVFYDQSTKQYGCGEWKITNVKERKYSHVQDHPLAKCIGVFGFSTSDIPKVTRWTYQAEKYMNEKCGK